MSNFSSPGTASGAPGGWGLGVPSSPEEQLWGFQDQNKAYKKGWSHGYEKYKKERAESVEYLCSE